MNIIYFQNDLRVRDNRAVADALKTGEPVIAIYVLNQKNRREKGGASKWWLHHSLLLLEKSLIKLNVILYYFVDEPKLEGKVFKNKYSTTLLHEPSSIEYKVFTPFWKKLRDKGLDDYLSIPSSQAQVFAPALGGVSLDSLNLLPTKPNWAVGFVHDIGEDAALRKLEIFLHQKLVGYSENRDYPSLDATSHLSSHLAFGEIAPQRIIQAATKYAQIHHTPQVDIDRFLAEIGWREFSYNMLYHNPQLPTKNWRAKFDNFQLDNNMELLALWQQGKTGYPIVDAGMRELWATGYMHNRVRMLVASFLIKDLLVDWRYGEQWFWDTLIDADIASNAASWQWVAGSGSDSSPYLRIFNPITQRERFDPTCAYISKWLGEDYATLPIVDHKIQRTIALARYSQAAT
jgi:deoxyribodipyrimidine photo-lyase